MKISDICGMKRVIYQKLVEHITAKEATVLTGARQTGKSTLLKQLRDYLELKGSGFAQHSGKLLRSAGVSCR